jgi:predicted transcriptional regulator
MSEKQEQTDGKKKGNGKPISLHPLTVEQVVKAMLETPPPPKKEHGAKASSA